MICQKLDNENGDYFSGHSLSGHHFSSMAGMAMNTEIVLAVLIGVGTLLGLYREWSSLRTQVRMQGERIANLEKAARLRMPHQAMEAILDARAALNKYKEEVLYEVSLIENAEGHLGDALSAGTKREENPDR